MTRPLKLDQADVLAVLKEIAGHTANALSFGEPADRIRWAYAPLTQVYGTDDAQDAHALLDQVIFNILVANTDAHAKNYSLILPVAASPCPAL